MDDPGITTEVRRDLPHHGHPRSITIALTGVAPGEEGYDAPGYYITIVGSANLSLAVDTLVSRHGAARLTDAIVGVAAELRPSDAEDIAEAAHEVIDGTDAATHEYLDRLARERTAAVQFLNRKEA